MSFKVLQCLALCHADVSPPPGIMLKNAINSGAATAITAWVSAYLMLEISRFSFVGRFKSPKSAKTEVKVPKFNLGVKFQRP